MHGKHYEYLEKEMIETAYGVNGLVKETKLCGNFYNGNCKRGRVLYCFGYSTFNNFFSQNPEEILTEMIDICKI